jgi:hypothetical protein
MSQPIENTSLFLSFISLAKCDFSNFFAQNPLIAWVGFPRAADGPLGADTKRHRNVSFHPSAVLHPKKNIQAA